MIGTTRNGLATIVRARSALLKISITAAISLFGGLSMPAAAEADFDGYWSVEVVAVEGACGAHTIKLEVRDGEVSFASFGATAEGAIGSNGRLRANIVRGDNIVRARGALRGELGHGNWASSKCAGLWTARRG